ncbi:MAG TPA: hypothetical protein VK427_04960 [Kofleriaceae bacterium]|nr:hypothetical protein [Kofleriaceae bacterium]
MTNFAKLPVMLMMACVTPAMAEEADALHETTGCRDVRGTLVEDLTTVGCKPGQPDCFVGEVRAHGLRGTTNFRSDGSIAGPPNAAPGWYTYSGIFEYTTRRGTIVTRETGVVHPVPGHAESGAVTAHQQILSGTGAYANATGHFFVSGFNINGHVETTVIGRVCR